MARTARKMSPHVDILGDLLVVWLKADEWWGKVDRGLRMQVGSWNVCRDGVKARI